ncbi:MAG: DUF1223 domain-containing protein [Alphaproteobacteria bacterium]|nr:DUF1223 domain-containing protein [Alphaproteobacteria bacterium]
MIDRRKLILAGAASITASSRARAASPPVLVELFTSQGCSSCPPADKVLSRLAVRERVIALAFHVDYWDYIGWKDPFASRANTQRQRDYASAFRNRSVYTPQMMFGGQVEQAVQSDAAAERILAQLSMPADRALDVVMVRDGGDVMIKVEGAADGTEVWGAAFQPHAETRVRRGENAGRVLRNANIVRQLRKLDSEFVWRDVDPALGLAVWVQDQGLGAVRGAAALPPLMSSAA